MVHEFMPGLPRMGRLTLNILLSFAQFEREVTGERIRDKIAASKRKGMLDGRDRAARLRRQRSKASRESG
jgi:DNA invertase Pin-like site-specific DNA recombinase